MPQPHSLPSHCLPCSRSSHAELSLTECFALVLHLEASTVTLKCHSNVSSLTPRQSSGVAAALAHDPVKLQHGGRFHPVYFPHYIITLKQRPNLEYSWDLSTYPAWHRVELNNGCLMTGPIGQDIYAMANILSVTRTLRNEISMR